MIIRIAGRERSDDSDEGDGEEGEEGEEDDEGVILKRSETKELTGRRRESVAACGVKGEEERSLTGMGEG